MPVTLSACSRTVPDSEVTSSAHLVARSRLKSTDFCTYSKYRATGSVRSTSGIYATTLACSVNFSTPCLKVSTDFSVGSRAWPAAAV